MRKTLSLFAVLVLFAGQDALAATVSFEPVDIRDATAAEIADDATLAGAKVNEYRVTTDADILRVGDVIINVSAPLYQNGNGDDDAPPNPAFVAVFPALAADSWITTPGGTAIAGGGFGTDNAAWFDTSNDGAVNSFLFATLTSSGMGTFNGVVSVAGATGPEVFPFSLPIGIPEPTTFMLASLGLIGIVAGRRRS